MAVAVPRIVAAVAIVAAGGAVAVGGVLVGRGRGSRRAEVGPGCHADAHTPHRTPQHNPGGASIKVRIGKIVYNTRNCRRHGAKSKRARRTLHRKFFNRAVTLAATSMLRHGRLALRQARTAISNGRRDQSFHQHSDSSMVPEAMLMAKSKQQQQAPIHDFYQRLQKARASRPQRASRCESHK